MSDEFNKKLFVFCWHDKVDKIYMQDSVRVHYSKRAMCRGYLMEFEQNKKMNPEEFELCVIGEFNEFTGVVTPYSEPEVLNPRAVYATTEEE